MNYYIQGDAAKAEQIKAAFKKLGYDISWPGGCANPDVINIGVERNGAKYVVAETSEYIKDIIKTHPDYKELEPPVEPKFKVGDWIVRGKGFVYEPSLITEIRDYYYYICELPNGERVTYTLNDVHKNFHLWTIKDAKDGDVLAADDGFIMIVKESRDSQWGWRLSRHCALHPNGFFDVHELQSNPDVFHPATKEQYDLLFAKMKEAGYEWDAKKKELRKIQLHYDIANFKPFDKVLVRYYSDENWKCGLFSHLSTYSGAKFVCVASTYVQCIPYNDDTKHLLGTTDTPSDEYINW